MNVPLVVWLLVALLVLPAVDAGAETDEGARESADDLIRLARSRAHEGDYAGAKSAYEEALALQESATDRDDLVVAGTLVELGWLLEGTGLHLDRAVTVFEQALAIQEEKLGTRHPDVARSLRGLGSALFGVGRYVEALDATERALDILEGHEDADEHELASTLNNLGVLLRRTGHYSEARRVMERAVAIRENQEDVVELALNLTNLAWVLEAIGLYDEARPLLDRALQLYETRAPDMALHISWTLLNLARVEREIGNLEVALRLYQRAVDLRENEVGADSIAAANARVNLGSALLQTGRADDAKESFEHVIRAYDARGFVNHPVRAKALHGLAELAAATGDLERAETSYRLALEIREEALGPGHPLLAATLVGLGRVLVQAGKDSEAFDASLRGEAGGREHFRLISQVLTERQALDYATTREPGLDVLVSVAMRTSERTILEATWDSVIRARALVLDEMATRHRSTGHDPSLAVLADAQRSARSRLAHLLVRGDEGIEPEQYRAILALARAESDAAERALAEASASYRRARGRGEIGFREVLRALPPESALVAFVRFEHYAPAEHDASRPVVPSYAAFVLRSGEDEPTVELLGTAAEIDRLVANWIARASAAPSPMQRLARAEEREAARAGTELRKRIWDPAATRVEGARRIFVVPDGQIHLVNFAALPWNDDRYFAERGPSVHYVSSERDLVRDRREPRARSLLSMGGVSFDAAPDAVLARQDRAPAIASVYRGPVTSCSDFRSMRFESLPGTEEEVREIARLWSLSSTPVDGEREAVTVLTGVSADEGRFKALAPRRSALHLATHGFFLGNDCDEERGTRLENPLLLSGLALAGANHRSRALAEDEDGILTAEEIAALDLSGVEWVVLSACGSGTGSVRSGEGILGLRRAFEIAGASTLILSLWSVDDYATLEWMKDLYHTRRSEGLSTAESVKSAYMRTLEWRREESRSTHPFYWGAFVAAGDWR